METNNKVKHQTSKKYLIAFSCASALASFALIAGAAFADEVTTGETHKIDTTTSVIANVETTADLVETKGIEAASSSESSTGALRKTLEKRLQQPLVKVKHLLKQQPLKHTQLQQETV